MFMKNYGTIYYIDREIVLHHLLWIMKRELLPKERKMILSRCGMSNEKPMDFNELAALFQLGSPIIAEQEYKKAIQKTRAAISGSILKTFISGNIPAE